MQGSLENPPGLPVSLCNNSAASDFDPAAIRRSVHHLGGFGTEETDGERSAINIKMDPDDVDTDALLKNLQVVTEDGNLDGIVTGKKNAFIFRQGKELSFCGGGNWIKLAKC